MNSELSGSDKPAESWTDEDVTRFELKLSDLTRRFKNLEALRAEVDAKGAGFDARRITVTRPDGQEINQIVGIDRECEGDIEALVEKVLEILPDNTQLWQAVIAKLTERVLDLASGTLPTLEDSKRASLSDWRKASRSRVRAKNRLVSKSLSEHLHKNC